MRFMLFKCGQNHSQPISRDKIVGLIHQKCSGKSKHGLSQFIVAEAQASFAKIMGMEMVELEGSSQKYYILRSILPKRFQDGLKEKKEDRHEKALLLTVLMILSLAGDQMSEGQKTIKTNKQTYQLLFDLLPPFSLLTFIHLDY